MFPHRKHTAWLFCPRRNLHKTHCWNIKLKEAAAAFPMKPESESLDTRADLRGLKRRRRRRIYKRDGEEQDGGARWVNQRLTWSSGSTVSRTSSCREINLCVCRVRGDLNGQQKPAELLVSERFAAAEPTHCFHLVCCQTLWLTWCSCCTHPHLFWFWLLFSWRCFSCLNT